MNKKCNMDNDHICYTCKWHDDFSAACCNGQSLDCADFTDDKHTCAKWEKKTAKEVNDR